MNKELKIKGKNSKIPRIVNTKNSIMRNEKTWLIDRKSKIRNRNLEPSRSRPQKQIREKSRTCMNVMLRSIFSLAPFFSLFFFFLCHSPLKDRRPVCRFIPIYNPAIQSITTPLSYFRYCRYCHFHCQTLPSASVSAHIPPQPDSQACGPWQHFSSACHIAARTIRDRALLEWLRCRVVLREIGGWPQIR